MNEPTTEHRAERLAAANARFLEAQEVDELGQAIMGVVRDAFEPRKALFTVIDGEGRRRVAGSVGDVGDAPGGSALPPDAEAHGVAAVWWDEGFSLPIVTTAGLTGEIRATYADRQEFDEGFRAAATLLAAQAGLALELLAARRDLALASHARTHLLTNVNHELRTPLTSILGFSDVLLSGLDGPLTAAQAEDAATIKRSARHLLERIDDLIDLS